MGSGTEAYITIGKRGHNERGWKCCIVTDYRTVVHQEPFQVVFCRKRGIFFYIRGNHACRVHMERCIDSSCTSRCPLRMNNTPQRIYYVLFLYYELPSVGMTITIRLPDIIKYLCSLCIIL